MAATGIINREFADARRRTDTLQRHCIKSMDLTTSIGRTIAQEADLKNEVRALHEVVTGFASTEGQLTALRQVLEKASRGQVHMPPIQEYEKDCTEYLKAALGNSQSSRTSKKYVEKFEIAAGLREGDEDVQVEDHGEVQTTCPITRMKMIEPMRCTRCGHSYSKAGVDHLLRRRQQNQCPIAGCNAFISWENLVPDTELEVALERIERQTQRQTQTRNEMDDESELDD